jgi:hypothetical protein
VAGRAAGRGMAADRTAEGRLSPRSIGLPPSRRTFPSIAWSLWPTPDQVRGALADRARLPGAETGTRAWHPTRDAAGAASIITPPCASRPMPS